MKDMPTDRERKALEKLGKTGRFHLKLMLATLILFICVFIVPENMAIVVVVPAIFLMIVCSISHINMQFFQKCPRCKKKLNRSNISCIHCGLELCLSAKPKGDGSEWLK
ncbi:MAG: hypothetical protein JKX76_14910 [Colwellia sp.]|nr:hypothetical protein [Colwellia sp.]